MKLTTLTIAILFTVNLYCQSITDSPYFASKAEKNAFNLKSNKDQFQLLYSIGNDDNEEANARYENYILFVSELDKKFKNKKPEKRIKLLYEAIHEKYFIKYLESPIFKDIFEKGEYNCVTATSMYAIAFEYLNIPHSIRQIPTHVYIIAFPESSRIILETTDPINGSFNVNSKKLNKYKDELIETKTISENEGDNFNTNQIFEDFVLADSSITISNLIGLQYHNLSIIKFDEKEFKLAYLESYKAQILCDDENINTWSNLLGSHLLEVRNSELEANEIFICLKRLVEFYKEEENASPILKNTYLELAKLIVINGKDIDKFNSVNKRFESLAAKELIYKEIYDFGHIISAEHYAKSIEYYKALNYLVKAYSQEETTYNFMIQEVILMHFGAIENATNGLDSLAKYEEYFPFIKTNQAIQRFGVWAYHKLIYNSFELNEADEGIAYLEVFKNKYTDKGFSQFPDSYIGSIYGSASSYFVRKKDYKKAKEQLEFGLSLNPECLELRRKLKMLNDLVEKGKY